MGCLVLGGWVPQNPKTPQPLINIPCYPVKPSSFAPSKTVFDQGCHAQSPALSKHHYPAKPVFSVPLAVLGQGGGSTGQL